ncbi:MAG: DeoR/GlpR family DNA-binding transcription regulator [Bacteroidales bacterium]|nr:DeoR/GlpR family DNA-binding transcription regulator [Tenuifilaceae bacterium]
MSNSIAERHQIILNRLKEQGFVNVSELSDELGVSLVTIRKDLKVLESRNLLYRTHGSASLTDPYITDRNISEKEKIGAKEKQQIALRAIDFIEPSDSIILASGSTILELARQLTSISQLQVVTASLNVAQILNVNPNIETHQLGGIIRKSSNSAVGPFAERMMKSYSCNKLFIGVDGIDNDFGLTTTNALEASLNQVMIASARKVFVLADSTKFGRRGFGKICDITDVDVVITDKGISGSMVKLIESTGVELVIA